MRISDMKTDPELERSGQWFNVMGDARAKIRRAGNREYLADVARQLKPWTAHVTSDTLPEGVMDKIQRGAMSRHVLVDWEKFVADDGSVVPYSSELAEQFLNDPAMHDFYEWVLTRSTKMEGFRRQTAQDDLGNSPGSSNGSESGVISRGSSDNSPAKESESTQSRPSLVSRLVSSLRGQPSATSTTRTSE